jgi:hypothetical protein
MTAHKKRGPGRPSFGAESMKRRQVFLSDADWELAQQLGKGNAAEGIRLALRDKQWVVELIKQQP